MKAQTSFKTYTEKLCPYTNSCRNSNTVHSRGGKDAVHTHTARGRIRVRAATGDRHNIAVLQRRMKREPWRQTERSSLRFLCSSEHLLEFGEMDISQPSVSLCDLARDSAEQPELWLASHDMAIPTSHRSFHRQKTLNRSMRMYCGQGGGISCSTRVNRVTFFRNARDAVTHASSHMHQSTAFWAKNSALQQEFSQNSLSFKSDVEPTDVNRELDTRVALPQQVHQVHADDIYKHYGSSLVVNRSSSHEKSHRASRTCDRTRPLSPARLAPLDWPHPVEHGAHLSGRAARLHLKVAFLTRASLAFLSQAWRYLACRHRRRRDDSSVGTGGSVMTELPRQAPKVLNSHSPAFPTICCVHTTGTRARPSRSTRRDSHCQREAVCMCSAGRRGATRMDLCTPRSGTRARSRVAIRQELALQSVFFRFMEGTSILL